MKKFLLSLAFIGAATFTTNAQTVLSQTGGAAPTVGTVACGNNQAPSLAENSYYRAYTLNANMNITSVKVGVGTVVGTVPITVKLHKSSGAFPASYPAGLTQIASTTKNLTTTSTATAIDVPFSSPISVAAGDIIVVEVNNIATNAGNAYYMGAISGSETAPAYIRAATCNVTTPTTFAAVSATANGKIVIDLIDNPNASSTEFFAQNFNLYPNPTADVLYISSKNGLEMKEIKITDLSGRVVRTLNNVSTINVSDLSAGTYLIDITTKEGKASSKFVKK
ncbi:T9SS type A sorting domain-containing protein [Paenimyroides aestuarii]|uniref:T9SS type A sorting domain-containing protein n=1 Tax=Paenimyroides aestuarii TaxID=2968490 RepID=A0ABY5NTW6_9FLAO|nr:T9SS type A sorting domain-containing protein [Paenimyroides aestuarii]UUV21902.1 T9SS type A sorting domain-containing protein [Paenimyroides aestuarii]